MNQFKSDEGLEVRRAVWLADITRTSHVLPWAALIDSSLELIEQKWNVNVAKPDWAWLQVHGFACEGLVMSICIFFWLSGWWLLSVWLRFNCNEHLTLFRSNTWHVASKRDSQWYTSFQFSNNIPHNKLMCTCACVTTHVCGCVYIPLGQRVHTWFILGMLGCGVCKCKWEWDQKSQWKDVWLYV